MNRRTTFDELDRLAREDRIRENRRSNDLFVRVNSLVNQLGVSSDCDGTQVKSRLRKLARQAGLSANEIDERWIRLHGGSEILPRAKPVSNAAGGKVKRIGEIKARLSAIEATYAPDDHLLVEHVRLRRELKALQEGGAQ